MEKRPIYMAKEAYIHGKRGLLTWQKRPTYMAKETHLYGKRDLVYGPRGLLRVAYGKRDLRIRQKRLSESSE